MKLSSEMLRLYAITDRSWLRGQTLANQVEKALSGGVTLVQLREKDMPEIAFFREAEEILRLCHRFGVPLLINDNVNVARKIGADGVHIGQSDMEATLARQILGREAIIGVTAKTVDQALAAQAAGADYLGCGAVFGTSTKLNTRPMTLETLKTICGTVSIPVAAIGGINRNNIPELKNTGISGIAVVSGIFAAENIKEECRLLRRLSDQISAGALSSFPYGVS